MRKFAHLLAAVIAAMLAAPKYVLEAGRWVLRTVLGPPPMPDAGYEAAAALDGVRAAAAPVPAEEATPAPDTVRDPDGVRVGAPFINRTPSETEEAILAWGKLARQYAVARITKGPEPDLSALDEPAEAWLRGLTDKECLRVYDFGARRLSDHMLGYHLISGLPRCMTRPQWLSGPIELTPSDGELYEDVKASLARDPGLVPGYRIAA